ncbi:monosaccharide ABC transporter membrane protein (CUT2 family) [Roseiarcus fermentans]|uniref:Monosaccharide ABC transporter membrane protein (CUT2 family) n=1 Tax=Roseiarcus fermentans TaxID=1473586 RepID=A0A366FV98_9HYPH|nr:ABC transporter permease [Roseiarcus fermentans]RBP17619.1 monosaccharide ABC transporter membrane protein (CUT2 family) [Roseiarcus fermentans]
MTADVGARRVAARPRIDLTVFLARYGTLLSLVALLIVFSIARPDVFPTVDNLLNIMNQISILGTMAFGLTVCLVMGLFDLSIAAMATLGGYIATFLLVQYPDTISVPVAVAIALGVAAAIGVMNGLIVSYLGISAFIATLATGSIITGAVLGISDSKTIITGIPDAFMAIGQGAIILGVANPILIMLGVGLVLWLMLEHTQLGRHLYAIGGNAEASRLSGIAVKRYAPFALAVCAVCAGLGGLMSAAVLGAGRPQGVGDGYLLNAFAAVFIGASSLRPGKFHILGTMIGVLLIGVINNGLSVMGVPTYWQYIVQGLLLIAALFSAGVLTMRRR